MSRDSSASALVVSCHQGIQPRVLWLQACWECSGSELIIAALSRIHYLHLVVTNTCYRCPGSTTCGLFEVPSFSAGNVLARSYDSLRTCSEAASGISMATTALTKMHGVLTHAGAHVRE
jgi:hypothetical protein